MYFFMRCIHGKVMRYFFWYDVFFHVECDGQDVVVWVHSESRNGIGDVGVNGERIEEIRDRLIENTVAGNACS